MTAEPPRAARFGWMFAAVWLVYLGENLSALLDQPNGWRRDVGLAALAGFAVLYLAVVNVVRRVRYVSGWTSTGPLVIRMIMRRRQRSAARGRDGDVREREPVR